MFDSDSSSGGYSLQYILLNQSLVTKDEDNILAESQGYLVVMACAS